MRKRIPTIDHPPGPVGTVVRDRDPTQRENFPKEKIVFRAQNLSARIFFRTKFESDRGRHGNSIGECDDCRDEGETGVRLDGSEQPNLTPTVPRRPVFAVTHST
jgi:hypothetical protein